MITSYSAKGVLTFNFRLEKEAYIVTVFNRLSGLSTSFRTTINEGDDLIRVLKGEK